MFSFKDLIKKEAVAFIAALAALISCFFVPVTNYVDYIDTDIIAVLFSLMMVVAAFRENNAFACLTHAVISRAKSSRGLGLALVMTVFFSSMLITNDVALIAFVPFTLMLWEQMGLSPVYVIVLETIAANMGSALAPTGNPQNLYLFSRYAIPPEEFFGITLRITAVSFIMLIIACQFIKKVPVDHSMAGEEAPRLLNPKYLFLYGALFILCILSVFDVVDTITAFASVCVVAAIMQPQLFGRVDYGLLATFAFFFIFVGNIQNIPTVTEFAGGYIEGREFESALIASQVISNVPAAMMLSAFTDNYRALVLGTDIGGLGTIIASLASLISYKNYCKTEEPHRLLYMTVFTVMNIIFLAVLYFYAKFFVL